MVSGYVLNTISKSQVATVWDGVHYIFLDSGAKQHVLRPEERFIRIGENDETTSRCIGDDVRI